MATADERMQILRMIENRQISAEEGARLLAALDEKPTPELAPSPLAQHARPLASRARHRPQVRQT